LIIKNYYLCTLSLQADSTHKIIYIANLSLKTNIFDLKDGWHIKNTMLKTYPLNVSNTDIFLKPELNKFSNGDGICVNIYLDI
jgi:hypothetical protein